jgi:predicted nucleic acid-binding protein
VSPEFVDTNIFVYAEDGSAGEKHSGSVRLIERLGEEGSGALSTQVLAEFYSAAFHKLHLSSELAEQTMAGLAGWTLHRPDHADLIRAAHLHRRYKIQWWDALIVNSALELGCSILWTEDLRHGQRIGGLTVRNPFT